MSHYLNNPETTFYSDPWKNCLPGNWSLVPKVLGTSLKSPEYRRGILDLQQTVIKDLCHGLRKPNFAEFQRIARRDKKAFLSNQCKEIEENNRMGKTRDLFKKIRDIKGTLQAKMGSIKDRNGMDLTEAEDIKKRWQEYTYMCQYTVLVFIIVVLICMSLLTKDARYHFICSWSI